MAELLGIGGESLVIKQRTIPLIGTFIAIKIMPIDGVDPDIKDSVEEDQKSIATFDTGLIATLIDYKNDSEMKLFERLFFGGGNVRNNQAEFECSTIKHPNVIGYNNVSLDIVDDYLALVAGKE